ncbi:hypothetical protein RJ55_05701 [Drechmeria coniospora]|nr:hypothetical protein RJ55_05701 [Drechmeria coniospora]
MASLLAKWPEGSGIKTRAIEDAKLMQKAVVEECSRSGKQIPPYQLSELIGKGSFGRVYKAKAQKTGMLVAIKIIDIEESDTVNPKLADTYSDLVKEINALKLLSDSGARNINHVIEAITVGQSMWMITEYCAGGSVATLMKPTAPGGLQEKWIIPILREVAEAIYWVHGQGIIHRDLKCANVLVTEVGDVQLCDFGVAGVIETKFDKRSTFIGTPHWMAPELFGQTASYGTEVDIWAFGAMVYEIASGLPPNVSDGIVAARLGTHLKQQTPRLEGDRYSPGLRDIVAYCLQKDPTKRPTIEQLQLHKYISNTEDTHPTSSLYHLVRGFRMWESQGGDRRSLFSAGGAQGLAEMASTALSNDEWNFSTTDTFDQQVLDNGDAQDVYDVYGSNVDFSQQAFEETWRPPKGKPRRRPPPQLPSVRVPLEKVFDPDTISNYEDNSRAYYGKLFQPPASDLPLRNDSTPPTDVRESLIDLDASLHGSDLSQFADMDTIKAGDPRASIEYDFDDGSHYPKSPVSDRAEGKGNRRTQDWKFPTMGSSAMANPATFKFPLTISSPIPETSQPHFPHQNQQATPLQSSMIFVDVASSKPSPTSRASVGSLIDLDMSFADSAAEYTRPSTSHSDLGSMSGSEMGGANPFELEKHASLYVMSTSVREPSMYVSDDSEYANALANLRGSVSDSEQTHTSPETHKKAVNGGRPYSLSDFTDMDPESLSPPQTVAPSMARFPLSYQDQQPPQPQPSRGHRDEPEPQNHALLPRLPVAPSSKVMEGKANTEEVKDELRRMVMCLEDHLNHANTYLFDLPIRRASVIKMEPVEDEN